MVERRAQSTTTAKTNELAHSCRDYHIIVPLPAIDLYPLRLNKALTQDTMRLHMLNGLFFELKNSFDCSFAPEFVSVYQCYTEKYVLTVWKMQCFFPYRYIRGAYVRVWRLHQRTDYPPPLLPPA